MKRRIAMSAVVLLAGCAGNPLARPGFFSGESHADPALHNDTAQMVLMVVGAIGCDAPEHIETKVIHYEPSNGISGHVWGQEAWFVSGCDNLYPIEVSFAEDGNGGTYFGLKPVGR